MYGVIRLSEITKVILTNTVTYSIVLGVTTWVWRAGKIESSRLGYLGI